MHIHSLVAENYKRLKAVEIQANGENVVLTGRNAQGKSSVLDAIMAALAGKQGSKQTTRPIRDGETHASVEVVLDDIRVVRKWTQAGSTVTVGPRDGKSKFNSPQSVLDRLIGKLAFDPLAFAEADPKAQVAALIDLIGARDTFDQIAKDRKAAYDQRTEVNREAKRVKAQLDSLPTITVQNGDRVNVAALVDQIRDAEAVAHKRESLLSQHRNLQQEIAVLEANLREAQGSLQGVIAEGKKLPAVIDVAPMVQRLAEAEEINKVADLEDKRDLLSDELNSLLGDAHDLTETVERCDDQKQAAIESAALPVEGLSFDDEGVLYHGVPFAQASAAERLRVSVGMAMAANPEVRVICIRDASLLDAESFAAIEEMAADKDFQVWFEKVADGTDVGVVIEDGTVKA